MKQVTQFTCFTSTEVQILTGSVFEDGESGAEEEAGDLKGFGTQFTCFTSTKVQILTSEVLRARQNGREGRVRRAHNECAGKDLLVYEVLSY